MLRLIKKNKFATNVFTIIGGTTFAQGLNIILSPIITRIFTPDEYGILLTFNAIVLLLSLGAFKYELALPIEKNNVKAMNILALCLLLHNIYVLLIIIFLIFYGKSFLNIFGSEILLDYRFLIPLGIFLSGLYTILNRWAYRDRHYPIISKTIINQSLFSNITKVLAGVLNFGAVGLIIGQIIGTSSGIKVLSKMILQQYRKYFSMINIKKIIWCFKRYKDFPLYNMPSSYLVNLGSSLPTMFYTATFGSIIAGHYGLAYTIVKLPMNLIGNAVSDVFFAEASKIGKENPKKVHKLFREVTKKIFLLGIFPLAILLLFGPELFSFIFGEKWFDSGRYAQVLAIMIFFMFTFAPSGKIYIVFEKQKIRLILDIIRVVLIVLTFFISFLFKFDAFITIWLYSITMSLNFFVMYVVSKMILNHAIKSL